MRNRFFVRRAALFLFLCCSFGFYANAQVHPMGSLSFLAPLGGDIKPVLGLNLAGGIETADDAMVRINLGIYEHAHTEDYVYGNAYSGSTYPGQIQIPVKYNIGLYCADVDYVRYFGDNDIYSEATGIYGFLGPGLMIATVQSTVGSYSKTDYYVTEDLSTQVIPSFTVNAGLGVDHYIKFGYLFFEPRITLPVGSYNSQQGSDMTLPFSIRLNAGIRIKVGD